MLYHSKSQLLEEKEEENEKSKEPWMEESEKRRLSLERRKQSWERRRETWERREERDKRDRLLAMGAKALCFNLRRRRKLEAVSSWLGFKIVFVFGFTFTLQFLWAICGIFTQFLSCFLFYFVVITLVCCDQNECYTGFLFLKEK